MRTRTLCHFELVAQAAGDRYTAIQVSNECIVYIKHVIDELERDNPRILGEEEQVSNPHPELSHLVLRHLKEGNSSFLPFFPFKSPFSPSK